MKKIAALFTAGYILLTFTACTNPGEQAAEATVKDFVQALYSRDREQLQEHAPFFADLESEAEAELFTSVQDFSDWEIKSVQARGKKAAVLVQFHSADKDLRIQFPLQAEKGEWKIQNNISTSTTIDFIPAQKPDNGS